MTLLFSKTKYTFNNWKSVNENKNTHRRIFYTRLVFKPRYIITSFLVILALVNVKFLIKKIIDDNNLIKQKFEIKKTKQISYDYMIYTFSTKDQFNDINKLSLI
jgi:hypothetical protein